MTRVTATLPARDDADTRELEPLDRYAAAGGMAPDRIRRILADVAMQLGDLHRAGRAHGGISPSTIGLDASGHARLLTPPVAPAANAEDAVRHEGYAAFEQYTDDPDTPCGPWTDIYALSATACALLTGLAPPCALARIVRDDYIPLARRRGQDEYDFCAVLDSGLAQDACARPRTIDEFARALHLDLRPAVSTAAPDHGTLGNEPTAEATGESSMPTQVAGGMPPEDSRRPLEDSDGLETTAAWASDRRDHGAANAPFNEPANQSAEATASVATASARTLDSEEITHSAIPIAFAGERTATRKRAPLLLVLAVIAMVAVALYALLRPQSTRQPDIVASSSSDPAEPAASSARPATPTSTPAATRPDSQAPIDAGAQTTTAQPSANPGSTVASAGAPNPSASSAATPGSEVQNEQGGSSASAPQSTSASAPSTSTGPAGNPAAGSAESLAQNAATSPAPSALPSLDTSPASGSAPSANGASPVASTAPSAPSSSTGTSADTTPASAGTAPSKGSSNEKSAPIQAAAAKSRTASKAPVSIEVSIRPWGEILVDGHSRGVSPPLRSLTLAPGKYSITVRNNADPDYHQTLEVTAGQPASISHKF